MSVPVHWLNDIRIHKTVTVFNYNKKYQRDLRRGHIAFSLYIISRIPPPPKKKLNSLLMMEEPGPPFNT